MSKSLTRHFHSSDNVNDLLPSINVHLPPLESSNRRRFYPTYTIDPVPSVVDKSATCLCSSFAPIVTCLLSFPPRSSNSSQNCSQWAPFTDDDVIVDKFPKLQRQSTLIIQVIFFFFGKRRKNKQTFLKAIFQNGNSSLPACQPGTNRNLRSEKAHRFVRAFTCF